MMRQSRDQCYYDVARGNILTRTDKSSVDRVSGDKENVLRHKFGMNTSKLDTKVGSHENGSHCNVMRRQEPSRRVGLHMKNYSKEASRVGNDNRKLMLDNSSVACRYLNDNSAKLGYVKSENKMAKKQRLKIIRGSLRSLYLDRTKPRLQELFRRVKEKMESGDGIVDSSNYNFQMMIKDLDTCGDEFVYNSSSGEIFFRNCSVPDEHWIDPKDPRDPYSPEIWSMFLQYINSLVCVGNKNYDLGSNSGFIRNFDLEDFGNGECKNMGFGIDDNVTTVDLSLLQGSDGLFNSDQSCYISVLSSCLPVTPLESGVTGAENVKSINLNAPHDLESTISSSNQTDENKVKGQKLQVPLSGQIENLDSKYSAKGSSQDCVQPSSLRFLPDYTSSEVNAMFHDCFIGQEASCSPSSPISILTSSSSPSLQSHSRYQFKGGRYGVALEIHRANIDKLSNLTLGELSHLVQLAINKGILQYENNFLKPRCTCVKIAAAVLSVDIEGGKMDDITGCREDGTPGLTKSCLSLTDKDLDLKSLREKIDEILVMYPNGILLSLIKKIFYKYRGKKLSPTIYGYTRVSALLLSDDFKDTCRLYFDECNHVLVQSTKYKTPSNIRLLREEKSQKDFTVMDLNLFHPNKGMCDITFEFMKHLNNCFPE